MILPNRSYVREEPSRDAKSIFIFCEGKKREYQYFRYYRDIDSRINIIIYELDPHEDNSPNGLLNIAEESFTNSNNSESDYTFVENDEVWIVLDCDKDKLDSRAPQIANVIEECNKRAGWNVAISNPCFEVWLYYHKFSVLPDELSEKPIWWKHKVADDIKGGFDSKKQPFVIETARNNAIDNFKAIENIPDVGRTDLFRLADTILPLVKEKLDKVLSRIE